MDIWGAKAPPRPPSNPPMVITEGVNNIAKHADHKVRISLNLANVFHTSYFSITVTQQLVLKAKINKYVVLLWN